MTKAQITSVWLNYGIISTFLLAILIINWSQIIFVSLLWSLIANWIAYEKDKEIEKLENKLRKQNNDVDPVVNITYRTYE